MKRRFIVANFSAAILTSLATQSASAVQDGRKLDSYREPYPRWHTSLYTREIGQGPPIVVLHGGPDFDHGYLLPDLDRLADTFRLIYYDQRGRGRSAEGVRPDDVTLSSDLEDIDRVRQHFRLDAPALLGTPGVRCWPWNTRCATRPVCRD